MNSKASRHLMIALGLASALAAFIATLQIVSAQSPAPTGQVETRSLSCPELALGGWPDPRASPECPAQSVGATLGMQSADSSLSSATDSVSGVRFVHIAKTENISSNLTYIDHYLTNDNPSAVVFVTQNRTPGGATTALFRHSTGVLYSSSEKKWAIFDQYYTDTMPIGASFNVLIPDPGANVFIHGATLLNTEDYYTIIDHPLTNDNPDALLFVTQNWNPGGVGGVYNDHPIGAYYWPLEERWLIVNQHYDDDMPIGAAFNVLVPELGARGVFAHVTTAENIVGSSSWIDHPLTNGNPNALLYVTHSIHHGEGYSHNHTTGVRYSAVEGKWGIYNRDITTMLPSRTFNVLVPVNDTGAFVHRAITENIVGNVTIIDHPLTNDRPHGLFFVTQNWNPGGGLGVYNDSPIGVGYWSLAGQWDIINRPPTETMPLSATFNVLVPNVDAGVFVHRATAGNILGHQTYIDYPPTNDDPNAILFVTQNANPGGGLGGTYNEHSIAVLYSVGRGEWGIMNQDFATTPLSITFNVLVPNSASNVFTHEATVDNIISNFTLIDHPMTNNRPRALVFVTQNWNPGGGFGIYNDHQIGVWYWDFAGRWAIFNQDKVAMPEGSAFNVLVVPCKIYLPLVMR